MTPTTDSGSLDEPRGLGRRRFLRLGLGGSAVLGLGSMLAIHTRGYGVPPSLVNQLRVLTPKEFLIVRSVASRITRIEGEERASSAHASELALRVDGLLRRLDSQNLRDFKRLLQVLEHALPLSTLHVSRFTRLEGSAQDEVLQAMMQSRVGLLRGAFDGLKSLVLLAYFSDSRTWGAIGYDGPLVGRPSDGWDVQSIRGGRAH